MDQVQSKINVDEMADIQDDIKEQMDKNEEVADLFIDFAKEGADELEDELE